jgi:NADH-quinone oxidoreductase subunit E
MNQDINSILTQFNVDHVTKRQKSALLLPILQKVQRKCGYISGEAVAAIADYLGISESRVQGVASFYAQFKFVPAAKHTITVCCGTACHVRGSTKLLDELSKRLGIGAGENTADMNFALETIACFGSCALAPVVVINEKVQGRMNRTKLMKQIDNLAAETKKAAAD